MQNYDKVVSNNRVDADFVCFRGLLTQIMLTPYDRRESWIILASKYNDTIYLCAEETQQKKIKKLAETSRDKMFQRYGHRFEKYIFANSPFEEPLGNKQPVIENEEFCMMFLTRLNGRHKILYGAEIDGVQSNEEIKDVNQLRSIPLVEAKVKRRENNARQLQNFYRHKARKFFCQSFLVGIDKVFVGLRNDDGIVDEVTSIALKILSDEAKKKNYWHATVCVNFLNDFLSKIKYDMRNIQNEHIIFKYEWNIEIADFVITRLIEEKSFNLLTRDYIDFLNNISN